MRRAPATVLALLGLLVAAPASDAAWGMPEQLTERGQTVGEIYNIVTVLGIVVFVIVFVWLVVVIWRFRETTGHGRSTHEKERHSLKAELAWFLIPLALVLYIGAIAYAGLVELDHGIPIEETELEIKIEASQWDWAARYPDGVVVRAGPDPTSGAVKNESVFVVPADTPILFNVTATDVIHAFQVLDANHAFVLFVDANPLGATKYNLQTASLPAGEYYVQCNKMCLNPGHAYMRARIRAVAPDAYALWHSEQVAVAGTSPSLVVRVPLEVQDGRAVGEDGKPLAPITAVRGARIVVEARDAPEPVSLRFGSESRTVPARETRNPFFAFTVEEPGVLEATVGDRTERVNVTVVDAEPLTVDLADFRFAPPRLQLQRGETYFITVKNVHNLPHNLFIGNYPGEVLAASPTIGGGETASFLATIDRAGDYVMWCNVPGHYESGMVGTVSVT